MDKYDKSSNERKVVFDYNYISCVYLKCYQLSLKSIDSSSNLFFYLNYIITCNKKNNIVHVKTKVLDEDFG